MRNTIQRSIVLSAVRALKTHPTAEEIYREINAAHPNISRGTVYRNLNVLAEQGTILRVLIPDAADRFDFNTVGHYHFRCREWDRVKVLQIAWWVVWQSDRCRLSVSGGYQQRNSPKIRLRSYRTHDSFQRKMCRMHSQRQDRNDRIGSSPVGYRQGFFVSSL